MRLDEEFDTLRQRRHGSVRKDQAPNHPVPLCPEAAALQTKLEEWIFSGFGDTVSLGQVHQGKFLLQEMWFRRRKSTDTSHHRCIDAIYFESFDRLDRMELDLRPPMNFIAAYERIERIERRQVTTRIKPAPPPAIQIHGIALGEQTSVGSD